VQPCSRKFKQIEDNLKYLMHIKYQRVQVDKEVLLDNLLGKAYTILLLDNSSLVNLATPFPKLVTPAFNMVNLTCKGSTPLRLIARDR